jgi:hypothetical protein
LRYAECNQVGHPGGSTAAHLRDQVGRPARIGELAAADDGGSATAQGRRVRVEHERTGDDPLAAGVAQDGPVAHSEGQRLGHRDSHGVGTQWPDMDRDSNRADVKHQLTGPSLGRWSVLA